MQVPAQQSLGDYSVLLVVNESRRSLNQISLNNSLERLKEQTMNNQSKEKRKRKGKSWGAETS